MQSRRLQRAFPFHRVVAVMLLAIGVYLPAGVGTAADYVDLRRPRLPKCSQPANACTGPGMPAAGSRRARAAMGQTERAIRWLTCPAVMHDFSPIQRSGASGAAFLRGS